ncbi:MAG: DUF2933 domain-containing protein [Patescibacteria group bacterium]
MKTNHLWIIGIIIAFIAGGLFIGKADIASVLPFAVVLLCPVMMIFMMKDHHKH